MKIVGKVIEVFLIIFIAILVFVNICYLYSKYINKDELTNILGYTYMKVQSNSMVPEFAYGDKVIVKLNSPYKEGDIITYKEDNVFVTHRVVEINDKTIITKGDANNVADKEINKTNVVGVVKYVIK